MVFEPLREDGLVQVALGLGSNLGDRMAALQSAIDLICADPATGSCQVSPIFETDPVGGPSQPDYLNAVLLIETELAPFGVLELAQRAEHAAERDRSVRWGPRTLDVDVLVYGQLLHDDPALTLPHPRMGQRAFVLVPLAELVPAMLLPQPSGAPRTVAEALDALGPRERVAVRVRPDLALRTPGGPTLGT